MSPFLLLMINTSMNFKEFYILMEKEHNGGLIIWLDDERDPSNKNTKKLFGTTGREVWCKTVRIAKEMIVANNGRIKKISFDNDLGEYEQEGKELAKWILEKTLDGDTGDFKIQRFDDWLVHSQNNIAASEIDNLMHDAQIVYDGIK